MACGFGPLAVLAGESAECGGAILILSEFIGVGFCEGLGPLLQEHVPREVR
jgi:hypothetical protein